MAALERAQAIINIEWKLVDAKRINFLEYINKNFSPKVLFYDDDPTNPPEGEIHGLTLMTKKINEQVKTLGSIIVDFKEKDSLHRTISVNIADAMLAQSRTMNEVLERLKVLEDKITKSRQDESRYKLYYPQSDSDTETGINISRIQSTSPDLSFTTASTRPLIQSSVVPGEKIRASERQEDEGEEKHPSAAPFYFPENIIRSKSDEPGPSRTEDVNSSSSPSTTNLNILQSHLIFQHPTHQDYSNPPPTHQDYTNCPPTHQDYSNLQPTHQDYTNCPPTHQDYSNPSPTQHPIFRDPSSPTHHLTYPLRRYTAPSGPGTMNNSSPRTGNRTNRTESLSPKSRSTSMSGPQRRPSRFRR